jgi:hypothetical protein
MARVNYSCIVECFAHPNLQFLFSYKISMVGMPGFGSATEYSVYAMYPYQILPDTQIGVDFQYYLIVK